jgi:hypothetical protein
MIPTGNTAIEKGKHCLKFVPEIIFEVKPTAVASESFSVNLPVFGSFNPV